MRLIAIDLDGTLLSEDGSINQVNTKAIWEVQRQGNIVVIASGRHFHEIKQILQNAGIQCPIISGNGAISFHKGRIIHKFLLPEKVILEIIEVLDKNSFYYEIHTNKGIFIQQDGGDLLNEEIKTFKNKRLVFLKYGLKVKSISNTINIVYSIFTIIEI